MKFRIRLFAVGCCSVLLLSACSDREANAAPGGPGQGIPPVASLTDGGRLAGDLHVHSEHSDDSSLNPIARITALTQSAGIDYLAITGHDKLVGGDMASTARIDPDFQNSLLIMLHGAERTTQRGHGNTYSARAHDRQTLYDLPDDADVRIGEQVRKEGISESSL